MKMSLGCAAAIIADAGTIRTSNAMAKARTFMTISFRGPSVRERPQAQLFLRDLPEPRQPARLDDEEDDDEATEHHQLDLLLQRHRQTDPEQVRHVGQEDRQEHDERRPQERAEDR